MSEPAVAAAYRAIRQRLTATSELWGQNAFPDLAPAKASKPFVVFNWTGGGEINERRIQDASLLVTVKCVAATLQEAFSGAGRISALLNDADLSDDVLEPGSEWAILNVNQERAVHLVENVDGQQIYHHGAIYRMRLERV